WRACRRARSRSRPPSCGGALLEELANPGYGTTHFVQPIRRIGRQIDQGPRRRIGVRTVAMPRRETWQGRTVSVVTDLDVAEMPGKVAGEPLAIVVANRIVRIKMRAVSPERGQEEIGQVLQSFVIE